MLVSKPVFIGQSASLPDYGEFIRNHGNLGYPQTSSDFASMLAKQQNEVKKANATTETTESTQKNQGIPLQSSTIELKKRPIDLQPGALFLDQRSLQTLSRLAQKQAENSDTQSKNHLKLTTHKEFVSNGSLGALSAQYESGNAGISAIGYDRVGGTSYGKYQIASRVGSFDEFVKFLKTEAPDLAVELQQAGPANTGSRKGKMPDTWKDISEREPERFLQLQEKFIEKTHFEPAMAALEGTELNTNSLTVQQVVWSTSVQHGAQGAKNIFNAVLENLENPTEKEFITKVYEKRAEKFTSSTQEVQNAVQNRLFAERNVALSLLS